MQSVVAARTLVCLAIASCAPPDAESFSFAVVAGESRVTVEDNHTLASYALYELAARGVLHIPHGVSRLAASELRLQTSMQPLFVVQTGEVVDGVHTDGLIIYTWKPCLADTAFAHEVMHALLCFEHADCDHHHRDARYWDAVPAINARYREEFCR